MEEQPPRQADETDELLAVLADRDRRIVLDYFLESGATVASVEDLVREVNERRHGRAEQTLVLHHSMLPTLDESGIVDYDDDRNVVRYSGNDLLESLLAAVRKVDRRGY